MADINKSSVAKLDGSTSEELLAETSRKIAIENSGRFLAAIPPNLSERENNIQKQLSIDNSSKFSKLRKLYRLLDELGDIAKPYIACGNGCSSCCHMNVQMSQLEADFIEKEEGIRSTPLTNSRTHDLEKFSGALCPFLKENTCSIYNSRPFACRKHISFDSSAYWCAPERSSKVEITLINYSCAEKVYLELACSWNAGVFADIRDFFKSTKNNDIENP